MLREYASQDGPTPEVLPCGLDTLWLSLPHTERYTSGFEDLRRRIPPPRKGYEDFTVVGLPLGVKSLTWTKAPRLIQFKGVGKMTSAEIVNTLVAVVNCDPLQLQVHRVDLTADVIGNGTIHDYRNSLMVGRKRKITEYTNPNREDSFEAQRRTSGRYETLYFGSSTALIGKLMGLHRQVVGDRSSTKSDRVISQEILWLASIIALGIGDRTPK